MEKTRELGGYRFDLQVEDIDLWWRMALAYDIRLIPEKLLGFRHNSGSVSQSNLERQVLNTLYIQYLLISHLWGLAPSPYEKAIMALESLLDRKQLNFREHMRQANIAVGKGNWLDGARNGVRACVVSPGSFLKRLAYEFSGNRAAVNGTDPVMFALQSEKLWPGEAHQ